MTHALTVLLLLALLVTLRVQRRRAEVRAFLARPVLSDEAFQVFLL